MKTKLKRLLAGFIDFYVCCFLGTLISNIIVLGNNKVTVISVSIYTISAIILFIFKDLVFKNTSIGKLIFKLEVKKTDNKKLIFVDVIKRNLPIIFLLPVEMYLLIVNNKRIGDIWAQTLIAERKQKTGDGT